MKELRPGWKTSEFWLVLVYSVLEAVEEHIAIDLPTEAIYAVMVYVLGRSMAKYAALKAQTP